jgi:hypothetical protein
MAPFGAPAAVNATVGAMDAMDAKDGKDAKDTAQAKDATHDGRTGTRGAEVRSVVVGLCAVGIVAAVIPLAVLQIPDAIAWALPASLSGPGPNAVASLLRASSLALPAMAVAVPLGALAVRRMRAGPVLLAGLLVIAAADLLGGTARTVLEIGVDRSLHGLGAGFALASVVAIVAEQRVAEQRVAEQRVAEQRKTRQWMAGWWAAVTVAGLAAAPELMRERVTSAGWHAALQPYPWLTGAALAVAAVYAVLTEETGTAAARNAFPVTERSQLALLAAPVAGICAITVAVSYQGDRGVAAAAIAAAITVSGIAAITARAGTTARFAVVCAVTGFTLAPSASAVTALAQPTVESGCTALAAALCGAALALMPSGARNGARVPLRAITATGLLLAASGFCVLYLKATGGTGHTLTLLCLPIAGGLSAALTASLRGTTAAGPTAPARALAGVVILLAGVVAGYLAAGAWQLHALTGARTAREIHGALVTAAGDWALVAAVVTAAVALALAGPALVGTWRESGHPPRSESGHPPRTEPAGQRAEPAELVGQLDNAGAGSAPASAGGAPDHG